MFAKLSSSLPTTTRGESVVWVEIFLASKQEAQQQKTMPCTESDHECSLTLLNNATIIVADDDDTCIQNADNVHEHMKQIELLPLTVLILFTNILVLAFIAANKKFHTPTYIFIASLGIADLFVGLVSIVTVATQASEKSQNMCLARIGLTVAAISASVWSLTCVAMDRYVAITHALLYKAIMTKRKTAAGIAFSWIISMVTGFLPLIGWKEDPYEEYCSFLYVLPRYYILFVFVISAIVPITIMFTIYGILFKTARFHIKQIQAIEKLQVDRRNSGLFGISTRNLRSVKTFAAVFGCVVITWLPLIMASLIQMFVQTDDCNLKEIIGTHLLVLGFSNSFLNPLIYAIGTKDFRRKVGHLCRRRCYRSDSQVFPEGQRR